MAKGERSTIFSTFRLWRTIKYEEIYIKEYDSPRTARTELTRYLRFYNEGRLHQALKYRTPAEVYWEERPSMSSLFGSDLEQEKN
jgi:putative transposase